MAKFIDIGYTDDGCSNYKCTSCGSVWESRSVPANYCPYCGQKGCFNPHSGGSFARFRRSKAERTRLFDGSSVEVPATYAVGAVISYDGVEIDRKWGERHLSLKEALECLFFHRRHGLHDFSYAWRKGTLPSDEEFLERCEASREFATEHNRSVRWILQRTAGRKVKAPYRAFWSR